jgi:hypothetical protein
MLEEYDSLITNDTWIFQDLPKGRKMVRSKRAYKVELVVDESVACFKERLVAKGFS